MVTHIVVHIVMVLEPEVTAAFTAVNDRTLQSLVVTVIPVIVEITPWNDVPVPSVSNIQLENRATWLGTVD